MIKGFIIASALAIATFFGYQAYPDTLVGATVIMRSQGGTATQSYDPNDDRIYYWNDASSSFKWLDIGTNLSISSNVLNASGGTGGTNSNIAFLTVGNTASLSFERSLTATSPLVFTDGGVNSTYNIDLAAGYSIGLTASQSAWESLKDTGPYCALSGCTLTGTLFGTRASLSSNLEILGFASISDSGYLKIPWGTAPTVDVNGKLAVDDSGFGQLVYYASGSAHALTNEFQSTISLSSASFSQFASRSLGFQFRGITVKHIWCKVSTATSVVINLSSNGTTDMDQLTCSTSGVYDDGNIANSTLTKGSELYLERKTITGEADFLTITYTYVKTRE